VTYPPKSNEKGKRGNMKGPDKSTIKARKKEEERATGAHERGPGLSYRVVSKKKMVGIKFILLPERAWCDGLRSQGVCVECAPPPVRRMGKKDSGRTPYSGC